MMKLTRTWLYIKNKSENQFNILQSSPLKTSPSVSHLDVISVTHPSGFQSLLAVLGGLFLLDKSPLRLLS